jgi:putative ATPase
VLSKKEDLTKILVKAKKNYSENRATILFLDEIHRWNKAQQDVLLPFVEKGIITLIGATTENPSFTVNNALISRARVYILEPISEEHIVKFLERNMSVIGERYPKIIFSPESLNLIASLGQGDLRGTLNLLEAACALQ